jgi:hypothetical protein
MDSDDDLFQHFPSPEESVSPSQRDPFQWFDSLVSSEESASQSQHPLQLLDDLLAGGSASDSHFEWFRDLFTSERHASFPNSPTPSPSRDSSECTDLYMEDQRPHRVGSDNHEKEISMNAAVMEWQPPSIYQVREFASKLK